MKLYRVLAGLFFSECLVAALPSTPMNVNNGTGIPILNQDTNSTVPNRYLVSFKSGLAQESIDKLVADITATIKSMNPGKRSLDNRALSVDPFFFEIDDTTHGVILDADDATIKALSKSQQVASIEADVKGSTDAVISQQNAGGNLVRLSHNSIDGHSTYDYDDSAGQGITVYVLDGGIRLTHEEFGGRATFGAGFAKDQSQEDSDGHGSHVAGIIGGAKYGVAKKVQLIAVKLDVEASQMLKALDFVLADVKKKKLEGKAVISMSMHVGASDIVDRKFKHMVDSGVVCVVSAGNGNSDAGKYSPGRSSSVITVGAMDHRYDYRWENSNYGPSVDIYAPGVGIKSATLGSDSDTRVLDGTSQSTPHVAGLAAYIMALEGITQASKVADRLKALAQQSPRVWGNAPNTTDLIASNGIDKSGPNSNTPRKKLPWVSADETYSSWNCGRVYSDEYCGTQVYCDAFDSSPKSRKQGFFKNAKECFDAHQPGPKLPWVEAPPAQTRPATCQDGVISDECPTPCGYDDVYDDYGCGTQVYCEAFDKLNPRPSSVRGYKNAEACFAAHEPNPSLAKPSGVVA